MKYDPIHYSEYLKLDQLLDSQELQSKKHGVKAHDETLFIIIHQVYELWFKQIIHELDSIYELFSKDVLAPNALGKISHRLDRVIKIQKVLNDQISIIETMKPLDFMDFRDFLVPASGFQSIQFRLIELKLGLKKKYRLPQDKKFFDSRLTEDQKEFLNAEEEKLTLLELIEKWLERMPYAESGNFDFWKSYQDSVAKMLNDDLSTIENHNYLIDKEKEFELKNLEATKETFKTLFDDKLYSTLLDDNKVRLNQKAKLSAIFITLYKDYPLFQLPHTIITQLIDIDEMFTTWRYRHAIMVHRMLGTKIGTGGSSGHEYLKRSTENNRAFVDFFDLSTFLIPRTYLPKIPKDLESKLGFQSE